MFHALTRGSQVLCRAHRLVPMFQKVDPNTSAMMTVNANRTLLYCAG